MPHQLTEILLAHRGSGVLIGDIPAGIAPQSAEEAYRIQNETVAALGPVGAWKVQPMPDAGEPFAAPILATTIFHDGVELQAERFPSLGIEVEIAVTIQHDLPLRPEGYEAADLERAIGSLHLALEVLASRFVERKSVPLLTGIADLQHSGAIVLGSAIPISPLPEFAHQGATLTIDGDVVGQTKGNATTANMMSSLAWLANHAASRGLPLRSGDVVITGSRIGPLPVTGRQVAAVAEGLGGVAATFN